MNSTVAELRKSGFRIRCNHYRYYFDFENDDYVLFHKREVEEANYLYEVICSTPESRGGETIVEVRTPEGVEVKGVAYCSPVDSYNKKLGVAKALGRAMQQLKKEATNGNS